MPRKKQPPATEQIPWPDRPFTTPAIHNATLLAEPPSDIVTTVRVDPASIAAGVALAQQERTTLRELREAGGIQIQPTADVVAECLREWVRQHDALEATRKDTTKPINESKRKVDALFAPGLTELQTLIDEAKALLGAWSVLQAQRAREALAIATEAAATAQLPELTQALNIVNTPTQKLEGVSTKAYWTARVVSVEHLPMRFQKCIADEAAIAAYVGKFEAHQVPDPVKGLVFELVGGVTQVRR